MLVIKQKLKNMKVRNLGITTALVSTLGCASTNTNLTAKAEAVQRMQQYAISRICADGFVEQYEARMQRMQGPAMNLLSNPNDRAIVEDISIGVVLDDERQCDANMRALFKSGMLSVDEAKFNAVFNPLLKNP